MINTNNFSQFTGRFVKDPTVSTKGQTKYCMFTLAIDRVLTKDQRDKLKAGDKSITTSDFPQFVIFGDAAEVIVKYFSKGKPIQLMAEFQTFTKDDGNGGKTYSSNFRVEGWGFVPKDTTDSSNNGGGGSYSNNNTKPAPKANTAPQNNDFEVPDDEIPF